MENYQKSKEDEEIPVISLLSQDDVSNEKNSKRKGIENESREEYKSKFVRCPICNISVLPQLINAHIDSQCYSQKNTNKISKQLTLQGGILEEEKKEISKKNIRGTKKKKKSSHLKTSVTNESHSSDRSRFVECPKCHQHFNTHLINTHLDICLSNKDRDSPLIKKTKTFTSDHAISTNDLKEIVIQHGNVHPIRTASTLNNISEDKNEQCAALLHKLVDYSVHTIETLSKDHTNTQFETQCPADETVTMFMKEQCERIIDTKCVNSSIPFDVPSQIHRFTLSLDFNDSRWNWNFYQDIVSSNDDEGKFSYISSKQIDLKGAPFSSCIFRITSNTELFSVPIDLSSQEFFSNQNKGPRFHLSNIILISMLHKSVCLSKPIAAVRTLLNLFKIHHFSFIIHHIIMVMMQHTILHPSLPLLIWLSDAADNGLLPSIDILEACLNIINEIASCPLKDYLFQSEIDSLPPELNVFDPRINELGEIEKSLVLSLLLYSSKCSNGEERELLFNYSRIWLQRFLKDSQIKKAPSLSSLPYLPLCSSPPQSWMHDLYAIYEPLYSNLNSRTIPVLQEDDVLLSAIDHTCSDIVDAIFLDPSTGDIICKAFPHLSNQNIRKELKQLIDICRSSLTDKKSLTKNFTPPHALLSDELKELFERILPTLDAFSYKFLAARLEY